MSLEKATFQDLLQELTSEVFVGRNEQISLFEENLQASRPQFLILAIYGQGGVGKSMLLRQFGRIARDNHHALTALVNEDQSSTIDVLAQLAKQFNSMNCLFKTFDQHLRAYRELKHQIESDPQAPKGLLDFALRNVARSGIRSLYRIPVADAVVELLSTPEAEDALVDHTNSLVTYVTEKFSNKEERTLVLEAESELTRSFLTDLNYFAEQRPVVIFFDTYEETAPYLEAWLQDLIRGKFGRFSPRVLFVIAGRNPLGQEWTDFKGALRMSELCEFTEAESREYLEHQDISDEARIKQLIEDSQSLPILLALLTSTSSGVSPGVTGTAVERFLRGTTPRQRRAALRASLPRRFNEDILSVVLDENDVKSIFEWLSKANFVYQRADGWAYHNVVRSMMVNHFRLSAPQEFTSLHNSLAEYYQSQSEEVAFKGKKARMFELEYLYHQLSADPDDYLHKALSNYLKILRSSYSFSTRWIQTIRQIADETEVHQLKRLAKLLEDGWNIIKGGEDYDRASDIFFRLSASRQLEIGPNTSNWMYYFEGRLCLVKGDHTSAEKCFRTLWNDKSVESDLRYYAASDIGELCTRRAMIDEAIEWNENALAMARKRGNKTQIALALYQLGTNYKRLGEYDRALELVEQSIAQFKREENVSFQIARALQDKGNTLTWLGELDRAIEAYQESLSFFEKESVLSVGETKHRLGWLYRLRGHLDESLQLHQEAVTILRSRNETYLYAKALHSMGNVLTEQHDYQGALDAFAEAMEIFEKFDAGRHKALILKDRAWSIFRTTDVKGALESAQLAVEMLERIGDKAQCSDGHLVMGRILTRNGNSEAAERHLLAAQHLCKGIEYEYLAIQIKCEMALLMVLTSRLDKAEGKITSTEVYARQKSMDNIKAQANVVHGAMALDQGNVDLAIKFFKESLKAAQAWNQYFPRDVIEQIKQILITNLSLAERVTLIKKLTDSLKEVAPERLSEIELLRVAGRKKAGEKESMDIYDVEGNPLGVALRSEIHSQGLWHRSFHCWIVFLSETGEKKVVFQRRGPFARDWPNYLDISVAGHYQAGEGLEGGIRELKEELGIEVAPTQLHKMGIRTIDEHLDNGTINREFQDIFFLETRYSFDDYEPSFPEVPEVFHLNIGDVHNLLTERYDSIEGRGIVIDPETGEAESIQQLFTRQDFIPNAIDYLCLIMKLADSFLTNVQARASVTSRYPLITEAIILPDGSHWQPEMRRA